MLTSKRCNNPSKLWFQRTYLDCIEMNFHIHWVAMTNLVGEHKDII